MKDLLKYYIALQPKIKEAMGDFKAGDRVWKHSTIFGEEIDSKIWPEDKRSEIVIIREQSSIESYWHCNNEKGEERLLTDQDMLDTTCYRLPLTIDQVNPGRGLWGMLDWSKLNADIWSDGLMSFWGSGYEGDTKKTTPTEAILKALCHQEGVEVK